MAFKVLTLSTLNLPARLKPATRKIPPAILEVAKKEFDRLRSYFLIPSASPVASNITVASKATPPYVRICGYFCTVNKYVITNHGPLPDVRLNIDRISNYSIFADIDLKNGFHKSPRHGAYISYVIHRYTMGPITFTLHAREYPNC